jgi:hypothetical protein
VVDHALVIEVAGHATVAEAVVEDVYPEDILSLTKRKGVGGLKTIKDVPLSIST